MHRFRDPQHTADALSIPTVIPMSPFNPEVDAANLRKAMKGLGTDEGVIISIMANRSNSQRQEIKQIYNKDRDLIKDLKGDLSGKFEDLVLALMTPLDEYLATELHRVISKPMANANIIIEILCTNDHKSVKKIKDAYKALFEKELSEDLKFESPGGELEKLLIALCTNERAEGPAEADSAPHLADTMYKTGLDKNGTDEDEIRKIVTTSSYATLHLVFDIYLKETGLSLGEVIERELKDEHKDAMLALYKSIGDPAVFFAEALHESMAGLGTRNKDLIRLVVSRCEKDTENIKVQYVKLYNKTLAQDIKGDTSGDFRKLLLALIKD